MAAVIRIAITILACSALIPFSSTASAQARPDRRSSPETKTMTAQLPRLGYLSFYVLDLNRSLAFYVDQLGMREQGRIPLPNGVQEILLGFGEGAAQQPGVILMHDSKRTTPYQHGDGFSRFVIYVAEVAPLVKRLAEQGVKVVRQPTTVDQLKLTYALIRDPDGYMIEFIQR